MGEAKITFKVSPKEMYEVQKLKDKSGLSWRELFFKGLGLETVRRVCGPKRTRTTPARTHPQGVVE